jgi:hypothetical protein
MHTIETGRGLFQIADDRKELDSWDLGNCLNWLARNDPNGEWSNFLEVLDDPKAWELLCEEIGDLDVEDARDQVWEQMQG